MKKLSFCLLVASLFALAAMAGEWTGYISESKCGAAHTDGSQKSIDCVKKCIKAGASPVFVTADKKVVKIANPDAVEDEHLGKKVKVTGDLEGGTLTIEDIETAE